MTREQSLVDLGSTDGDLRLRAARSLATEGLFEDVDTLRAVLRTESVPWVRAALVAAIETLAVGQPSAVESPPESGGLGSESVYLDGLQLTTDRVVHELRSVTGALRYWAEKEYEAYVGSKTEGQVERLRRCLEAIETLGDAASVPTLAEFDLADLVLDEVAVVESSGGVVQAIGPRPFSVVGAKGALTLVVRNALANAIEAGSDIRINWGAGANDTWIAVLNRGTGLPVEVEPLFEFGSTTKANHVGAGLAIISHYAVSLRGVSSLTEEADGSVKLEFRWPGAIGDG